MVNIRGPIDSDSTNKFFQDIMKLDKENEINIFNNSISYFGLDLLGS